MARRKSSLNKPKATVYVAEIKSLYEATIFFISQCFSLQKQIDATKTSQKEESEKNDQNQNESLTLNRWIVIGLFVIVYLTDIVCMQGYLHYIFEDYDPIASWLFRVVAPFFLLFAYIGGIWFNYRKQFEYDRACSAYEDDNEEHEDIANASEPPSAFALWLSRWIKFLPIVAPVGGVAAQIALFAGVGDFYRVMSYTCLLCLVVASHLGLLINGEMVWKTLVQMFRKKETDFVPDRQTLEKELATMRGNFSARFSMLVSLFSQFRTKFPSHPYAPMFSIAEKQFIANFFGIDIAKAQTPESFLILFNQSNVKSPQKPHNGKTV